MRIDRTKILSEKIISLEAKEDYKRLDSLSAKNLIWSFKKGDDLTVRKVVREIKTTQNDKVDFDVNTQYELIAINGKNVPKIGSNIIPNNLVEGNSSKLKTIVILGLITLGYVAYKQLKK